MANTLLTIQWIARDLLKRNKPLRVGDTIPIRVPQRFSMASAVAPVHPAVVMALGATAVLVNPQPISRRALFGLAWKGRG